MLQGTGVVPLLWEFAEIADEIVCARAPEYFAAVGQWYRDFAQTTDEEVRDLLDDAPSFAGRRDSRDSSGPCSPVIRAVE